ncbi:MAG: NAD-binding protein [Lachnospiraceae bacterium]|nr:NAD-binding protein [Lachnospiraceae bacterium]
MEGKNDYTVIAGCGRLGASIAGKLSDEKKDVMVLDCDKTAFRKLPCSYGGLTMAASATDLERLTAAELNKATAFIAVTDYDCVNICAAQIAKKVFRIPKVVARIYDEEKIDLVKDMGIDTICPSELSEKEISNYEVIRELSREMCC